LKEYHHPVIFSGESTMSDVISCLRSIWKMLLWLGLTVATAAAGERVLFDFAEPGCEKAWSNIDIYALRQAEAKAEAEARAKAGQPAARLPAALPAEPPVKIERSEHGTGSGRYALKLTFAGGRFPTVSAKSPLEDWRPYKSFRAEATASRTCLLVFRAMARTSRYGTGYNDGCSRWEFAARLEAGRNTLVAPVPPYAEQLWKDVHAVQLSMYRPKEGEVVFVDHIRLSTEAAPATSPFTSTLLVPPGKYRVSGTNMEVKDVDELADKLKDQRAEPQDKTVEQAEAGIQAQYERLKKDHPKAVLVMLRDGQVGYDPANPAKPFAGWADAGTPSHLPMALTLANFSNSGRSEEIETCFRQRPGFQRVDLSSIPRGADILGAWLIVVRGANLGDQWKTKPTMFVAEPCNRPWREYEVNVFECAADKFWKDYAALSWGDEGDCAPVLLAHGPSGGTTCSWDFTQAVRYWTDGKHVNNGFILYGSPKYVDYLHIYTRECHEPKNRPGLAVVYEPGD